MKIAIPISLLSKYRRALMAVAMFWIAFHHARFPITNKAISFILVTCGYVGVSLFFFLSAFSMYYSYKKDNNYLSFIKKRLIRILPYYVLYSLFMIFVVKDNYISYIGVDFFLKNQLENWFTYVILVLYLLTPLYLKQFNLKPLVYTIVGVILVFLVCIILNNFSFTYAWFNVAIYLLGFYFAYLNDKNGSINIFLVLITFIFGFVLMYYMYHNFGNDVLHVYPCIFIAPSMLLLLAYVFDKIRIFNKFLEYCGEYTYQFYLVNIPFVACLYDNYDRLFISGIGFDWWINTAGIVLSFVLSVVFKKMVDCIINKRRSLL